MDDSCRKTMNSTLNDAGQVENRVKVGIQQVGEPGLIRSPYFVGVIPLVIQPKPPYCN